MSDTFPQIFLIGFMASGKSSIARELAQILHLEATDLDTLIEAEIGMTISRFFAERGEDEFRLVESATLREAVYSDSGPRIVATGGGIVLLEENRRLLQEAGSRGAAVIYLKAEADVIAQRIRRQPGLRPLIDGEKLLNLEETRIRVYCLLETRNPLYEEVASLVINSSEGSPQEIAQNIQSRLLA